MNQAEGTLQQPYDPKYQKEQNIKHLSFHAYLRKLDIAANKTTSSSSNTFIPPLEEPDFKVQVPCSSGTHPSWPAGICTKCQPSAVTLSLQQYRMVDHVEFATPLLIENLLNFWRSTRMQRFGWLLGRFEAYDKVPMGIKAVVEAIHEPPQAGDEDGIQLGVPWEDEDKVESLANMCGLQVVGMIFTDLVPDEEKRSEGKVLCKRHKDSFFLSSLEAIFAAREAKKRPNLSRFSATGKFSSKFVTCVVTGNLEGDVAVEAYQVSDQAMAMVEADMIEASVDPGVVRIKEDTSGDADSSKKRYIPDVFYTYHNQYNLQVKESAKPCFPTDYLCVSVSQTAVPAPSTPPLLPRAGPVLTLYSLLFSSQTVSLRTPPLVLPVRKSKHSQRKTGLAYKTSPSRPWLRASARLRRVYHDLSAPQKPDWTCYARWPT